MIRNPTVEIRWSYDCLKFYWIRAHMFPCYVWHVVVILSFWTSFTIQQDGLHTDNTHEQDTFKRVCSSGLISIYFFQNICGFKRVSFALFWDINWTFIEQACFCRTDFPMASGTPDHVVYHWMTGCQLSLNVCCPEVRWYISISNTYIFLLRVFFFFFGCHQRIFLI